MSVPRVTVGLPVYNGARYVRGCVERVLAQTLGDLEVVVSDNASTDGTEAIVRELAARDARVRYHRHPENLGAAGNFNSLVPMARAPLFKWLAHDDVIEPTYLAECVGALERHPRAVLAQSAGRIIDRDGAPVPTRTHPFGEGHVPDRGVHWKRLDSRSVAVRCFAVAASLTADSEFYGVVRTDVLRSTRLNRGFYGDDRTLLFELALRGPFVEAPPGLWARRLPTTLTMSEQERRAYHSPTAAGGTRRRRLLEYLDAVDLHERAPVARHVRRSATRLGWWALTARVMPKRPSTLRARLRSSRA